VRAYKLTELIGQFNLAHAYTFCRKPSA